MPLIFYGDGWKKSVNKFIVPPKLTAVTDAYATVLDDAGIEPQDEHASLYSGKSLFDKGY